MVKIIGKDNCVYWPEKISMSQMIKKCLEKSLSIFADGYDSSYIKQMLSNDKILCSRPLYTPFNYTELITPTQNILVMLNSLEPLNNNIGLKRRAKIIHFSHSFV